MSLYKLPPSSLPLYLDFFNRHAVNGELCPVVIRGILEKLGHKVTSSQIKSIINSVSINPSGINLQAFVDLVSNYHELSNPVDELQAAFRIYDTKNLGALSRADIASMFKQLHQTVDLDKLFDEVDRDGNGFIEYDEFVAMMKLA